MLALTGFVRDERGRPPFLEAEFRMRVKIAANSGQFVGKASIRGRQAWRGSLPERV
jgi:hypothetical protein